ncbi:glycosyl hydrolase family 43 [Myxococcota bacterium]|nr:glycosyl hydrolase family 43 [Myxococcota bacterium]
MTDRPLPVTWADHPDNPLIRPPFPEFLIADPTFLPPDQSPDGRWHLFAHGILLGIHHFASEDGVAWRRLGRVCWGMRPHLVRWQDDYLLLFERPLGPAATGIAWCRSRDLVTFSKPRVALRPSLPWEGDRVRTVGNPCGVVRPDGFWIYYSAGLSWLRDCGFPEPRHIGVAFGPGPEGPFRKHPEPLWSPDPAVPWRNLGSGAVKVIPWGSGWIGFQNGIYVDPEGRSRSDIRLHRSDDGIRWEEAHDRPLVRPEPGWKRALVYALDVRPLEDRLVMFYNARSGWRFGVERIGRADCLTGIPRQSLASDRRGSLEDISRFPISQVASNPGIQERGCR